MNTPHRQINVHHTPDYSNNPGGRLPDSQNNPGARLPDGRHNVDSSLPYNQHNPDSHLSDGRHIPDSSLPYNQHNPGGRLPEDRHNPSGRLPDGRHNSGGHLLDDQRNPNGRQAPGHHNAQYNKHHAKESLTTCVTKLICTFFLGVVFTVGLVMFILWISLRPHRPRFYIQDFSIPDLANPNGFSTARITFNITARNPNLDIGIYYDTMNLTVYYQDHAIAESPLLFAFYQSPKKASVIYGTLSGPTLRIDRARWRQLSAAQRRGAVPFKVDVASSIRFKVSTWGSRNHKMHANCEIGVGSNGVILASDRKKKCPVYFT